MTVAPREIFPLPVYDPALAPLRADARLLSRQVRSRLRQSRELEDDIAEAITSLNELNGKGEFDKERHSPSLAQTSCLAHVREVMSRQGAPPCTTTAALTELCGAGPCYEQGPRAPYQKELISIPQIESLLEASPMAARYFKDELSTSGRIGNGRSCDLLTHLLRLMYLHCLHIHTPILILFGIPRFMRSFY